MSRTGKMEIFILLSTQNNDITRIVNWHVNLYVSCKNCKIQKFHCKCQLFILFHHGLMHSFICRESTFSEEWKPDFHCVNSCYFQTSLWKKILLKIRFPVFWFSWFVNQGCLWKSVRNISIKVFLRQSCLLVFS